MEIDFYCAEDPLNKNAFSGVPYHMLGGLKSHPDIKTHVFNTFDPERMTSDVLVVLVSCDNIHDRLSEIPAGRKLVYVTDATPSFFHNNYNLPGLAEKIALEKKVIDRADLVLFGSHQMIDHAVRDFGEEVRSKVEAIPWGLNLDRAPERPLDKPIGDRLELLFVGRDWDRKGGPAAIELFDRLRADGISCRLTIVGCSPEEARGRKGIAVYRYLNKNRWLDAWRYRRLLERGHFLILPTHADCAPMVFAEANAFGVPVLTSDVGGIPSVIDPGRNGFMFPLADGVIPYLDTVKALIADPDRYAALRRSSHEVFRTRLNWPTWAQHLVEVLQRRGLA